MDAIPITTDLPARGPGTLSAPRPSREPGPKVELVIRAEDDDPGRGWLLEAEVRRALRAGGRHFCVDLSALRLVDEALLAALVRCQRMVRIAGGRLVIETPSVAIRRALAASGLDRHLRTGPLGSAETDW